MEQQTTENGGIRLRRLNAIMISIAIIIAVVLLFVTFNTQQRFRAMEEATERYILAQQDAANMQAGSDFLTDRVRTFIVTGDRSSADDFFEEIEVTRRRDRAIEDMENYLSDAEVAKYLSEALRLSNELAEIERYAMRLAIEADGYDVKEYPPALQAVTLREQDLALSPTEQLAAAERLVFDESYQQHKEDIRTNVRQCERALSGLTERLQNESVERLQTVLMLQTVLLVLVVLIVLAIVICTSQLIIRPIESVVEAISTERTVPEQGAYELRFLARTYNKVFAQTKEHQDRLAYEASHDQLTGLYNRKVFEKMRESAGRRAQTMLLFDVDSFKSVNDTYGHSTGDLVLQKVANALRSNFRSEDYVCRIGGDEFAVLMLHTNSTMRELIERKILRITKMLADSSDGLPTVTLSIGVAFCDRENPTDDIYKDADTAQYSVKERGRNGYAFYGDAV